MSEAEKNLVAWLRDQKMHDSASLVERLRAELAAEQTLRAMLETSERMKLEALDAAEAERDALRALLREALAHLKTGQWAVPTDITLMSRIDAALKASPDGR